MRSKSAIYLIACVVILVGGVLLFVRPKSQGVPRQDLSSGSSVVTEAEQSSVSTTGIAVVSGNDVASLLTDTAWFVQVKPRNFDPLVASLTQFKEKVVGLQAWKKLNLDEVLVQQFQRGFAEKLAKDGQMNAFPFEVFQAQLGELASQWNAVDEILIAAGGSATTLKTPQANISIPRVLARIRYAAGQEERAKTTLANAQKEILEQLKDPSGQAPVTAEKLEGEEGLRFTLRSEQASAPLTGTVRRTGSTVDTVVGADSAASFFTTDAARTLSAMPRWAAVRSSLTQDAAVSGYVNAASLVGFFDEIVQSAMKTPDAREQLAQLDSVMKMYKEMESLAFALDFKEGTTLKSCVQLVPGSETAKFYSDFLLAPGALEPQTVHFMSMLDEKSIFGLYFGIAPFGGYYSTVVKQVETALQGSNFSQDDRSVMELVKKVQNALQRVKFQSVGLMVGPPVMPPIVGAGVYLGGSNLTGETLLSETVLTINEIVEAVRGAVGGGQLAAKAELQKDGEGKSFIRLNTGGLILAGGLAGENEIVFSIDRELVRTFAKRIETNKSHLDNLALSSTVKGRLRQSDYFVYLNTDVLVDLAGTFAPLFLSDPNLPVKIDPEDVQEALRLLRVSFLSFQRSYKEPSGGVCNDGSSLLLSAH